MLQLQMGNACTAIDSSTVVQPDTILPNVQNKSLLCFGDANGSVTALPTGVWKLYNL